MEWKYSTFLLKCTHSKIDLQCSSAISCVWIHIHCGLQPSERQVEETREAAAVFGCIEAPAMSSLHTDLISLTQLDNSTAGAQVIGICSKCSAHYLTINLNSKVQINITIHGVEKIKDIDAPSWSCEDACCLVVAVAMVCDDVTENELVVQHLESILSKEGHLPWKQANGSLHCYKTPVTHSHICAHMLNTKTHTSAHAAHTNAGTHEHTHPRTNTHAHINTPHTTHR